VIDHERFDLPFRPFEFQAKLFLERIEYRSCRVGCPGAAIGEIPRPKGVQRGLLSRKLDAHIEPASDSGLVNYRAV
jgi:hypothetical protein